MSHVVVAPGYGGPDVLALVEIDSGHPGPGEVLIDVRAAGVNPIDVKRYSGAFGDDPSRLPMRLGFEVAGVVSAIGSDAVGALGPLHPGDEVIAYRVDGGYASQLIVAGSTLLPKPTTLTFEAASGLMLAGATAIHALVATAVTAGDTVLLHGGAGGVGLMVVQLAVNRGARVIATASERNHGYLRDLGAVPVTYGGGLADRVRAVAPAGVQAAIDTVGTDEAIDTSLELVTDRERIATIANPRRGLESSLKTLGGGPGADPGVDVRATARVELVEQAQAGRLQVRVAESFPLVEVAAAHRRLSAGHPGGKIVLVP